MGLTDKLPLLNSKSKIVKIIGYVLYAFVILMIIGAMAPSEDNVATASASAPVLSVTLDGWNFSANIGDEWRADSHPSTVIDHEYKNEGHQGITWTGASANAIFFIPKTEDEKRYSGIGGKSGRISIKVLGIPPEAKKYDFLGAALYDLEWYSVGEGKEEDLFVGGREAHLWELPQTLDGVDYDNSLLAVQLSDTQIATIQVNRWDGSDTSATEVINSFNISRV
jgi:hypothetical protein